MTSDKQSNARRTAVESKSNRSCNHRIRLELCVGRSTLKKALVDPPTSVPYWISVCLARSSAFSIGVSIRSTVRNAARLAVYVEMMIRVKNHQTLPTTRPDTDLRRSRQPGSFTNGLFPSPYSDLDIFYCKM